AHAIVRAAPLLPEQSGNVASYPQGTTNYSFGVIPSFSISFTSSSFRPAAFFSASPRNPCVALAEASAHSRFSWAYFSFASASAVLSIPSGRRAPREYASSLFFTASRDSVTVSLKLSQDLRNSSFFAAVAGGRPLALPSASCAAL